MSRGEYWELLSDLYQSYDGKSLVDKTILQERILEMTYDRIKELEIKVATLVPSHDSDNAKI